MLEIKRDLRKIELLSPAKNLEYGKAAVDYGADALYIGGEGYGARASVGNSIEDLAELISYAHLFSAKVYITVNTLLYDNELPKVESFIHKLYSIGADAIIIQDLGILELNLPPIPIHASTQMNNFTKEKVDFLEKIGIQRVVLARELSLNQIDRIHNFSPNIELEAFVHGALCSGLSGQCYLSLALTSRSGNRGVCAQPCRNKYTLVNQEGKILIKDKYLLSPKDFNASELIPQLISSGITSFKIEGRLKDITYLKNITAYYRREIDKCINNNPEKYTRSSIGRVDIEFQPNPYKSFNRGFTNFYLEERKSEIGDIHNPRAKGEYLGKIERIKGNSFALDNKVKMENGDGLWFMDKDNNIQGFLVNGFDGIWIKPNKELELNISTPIYRNYDKAFEKSLLQSKTRRRIGVDIILEGTLNGFELIIKDESEVEVRVNEDFEKTKAKNLDSYDEKLLNQIAALGQTPFYLKSFTNNTKEKYFFPNSYINSLRRKACESLERKRIEENKPQPKEFKPNNYPYFQTKLDYRANIINQKAIEFFKRHGVEEIEKGLDETLNFENKEIFTSRHCILFQLGYCKLKNNLPKDYNQPLYLKDNKNTYQITFDCQECLMKMKFIL